MKKYISLLLIVLFWGCLYGQEKPPKDSISEKSVTQMRDSIAHLNDEIFKKLKDYSDEKGGLTKRLHRWLVRSSRRPTRAPERPSPDYKPFEDKIIRNVFIRVNDPFGYSIYDHDKRPRNWGERTGNKIHIESDETAIEKYLLFKEGQYLDTLLIQESGRLLRQQRYVRDVVFEPVMLDGTADSLDIIVRVLDSWSLLPHGSISTNKMRVGLKERNLFGWGHELAANYSKRFSDKSQGGFGSYLAPNIKGTFFDFHGQYSYDLDNYYDTYVSINRDFFSPVTSWAGGAFVQMKSLERPVLGDSLWFEEEELRYVYQNYWAGYSFPIFGKKSKDRRTTHFVMSARLGILTYLKSPSSDLDETNFFSDEGFALGSIGVNNQQFMEDTYIFKDGEIEDVPVGTLFTVTSGLQRKLGENRLYGGMRLASGRYLPWGFLSGNLEVGGYLNHKEIEQGTISLKLNYFSNLVDIGGGWWMRQFVKPQIVLGVNRLDSRLDRLGLNEEPYFRGIDSYEYMDYESKYSFSDYKIGNIRGFRSYAQGTNKYVLDLQTQFYSPYTLLGFRFNPFIGASVGYLGGKHKSFESDRVYSAISLGVVVRNDYFVLSSFQLSFTFYPSMPGQGNNVIKLNGLRNNYFGFQDYRIDAPRTVVYQ